MIRFEAPPGPIRIGVSACLLGEPVRFDGGHKREDFLVRALGDWFEYLPFCPEVSIGLGIPRPPIRLVRIDDTVRVRGVRDPQADHTLALDEAAAQRRTLHEQLHGYVLKSKSPSCGMERVKVYSPEGHPDGSSAGAFAARLMHDLPNLPVEDEGRLHDPLLRENFVTRVFVYARWKALTRHPPAKAALLDFHTRHKLLLLAHNETGYRRMGRLVADLKGRISQNWLADYEHELMQSLKRRASRKRHVNVLMHVAGYFKRVLDARDREELAQLIEDYRLERVPIVVPLTLLQHHLRRHPDPWLLGQHYFAPHPEVLGLRNLL